jgi:hypothetical protein
MNFYKTSIGLVVVLFLLSSCGGGGTISIPTNTSAVHRITFVYRDGSDIPLGECINASTNYSLLISAKDNINPQFVFEFNGTPHEVSILIDDSRLFDVELVDGVNTARNLTSGDVTKLYFGAPRGDFEFVD